MTEVHSHTFEPSGPRGIPGRSTGLDIPGPVSLPPPSSAGRIRNSHLAIDTFSPVNQNGSFEFDRVLKSGYVQKRTRKTKAWKRIYLVLRPNTLSIYRDNKEDKLRHKIQLADVTAVAFLKDPKQKRQHLFGIFSPSRNWHLEADSQQHAQEWVDLIRNEARIEEEEEEMLLASPIGQNAGSHYGFEQAISSREAQQRLHDERLGSSSPEPIEPLTRPLRSTSIDHSGWRRPSHTIEYSGNEISDVSDVEVSRVPLQAKSGISIPEEDLAVQPPHPPFLNRTGSEASGFNINATIESDPERVVWQGHLLLLKSIRGVRQWKDLWVVIRPRNLTLYKNESEYSPILIIGMGSVINAVDIDPLSKSKTLCMQVITEEKSYKFCAKDEEGLNKSLGALKCLLARRKELEGKSRTRQ